MIEQRGHWKTRIGFVLAASGSAIGLGNIWKFPYIVGENGGGAFVLVYLISIAAVGLPILLAELYIGRNAQSNAVAAFEKVHVPKTPWRFVGMLGVLSAFLILSFYSVVGGWVLNFAWLSLINAFSGLSDSEIQAQLGALFSDYSRQIGFHAFFMLMTILIVMKGVQAGIERWNRVLMPTLLAILALLFVYSVTLDGFSSSLSFMFSPDFSQLTGSAVLEAVGHSFFTLSLGMGAMITYGSYLQRNESLPRVGISVAFMDTAIAIVMGVVIFSVVFNYGFEAGGGPTLMFQTLPVLFTKMPGGYFIAVGFFMLVAFAALTSAISLLEVVVAYGDETLDIPRKITTSVAGAIIFVLGILAALSTNVLAEFTPILGLTFFDLFDSFTSKFALPFGGLMISLFYGWVLGPKAIAATIDKPVASVFVTGLVWTVRVIAPIAVLITLIYGLR